ncbi:peptide deformylase [Helicovermis profundi]|uniref:Peptide deformylase n=1 Tax=Helicovermis profundi TaxID=3065157 RepID=A0AAU9E4V9_9FIRM|nr:peptide deformylase [Clostridia bacterium S502]
MASRTIRIDEDPVLRKKSREVKEVDSKIVNLIDDMIETMYDADGIGLAAPQVGILKRIIVIDLYDDTGVKILINPEIIEQSGHQFEMEGCLSVPGVSGTVSRPMNVKVKGLDKKGEYKEYEAEGLLARAFCHEIDHLDGILFTDKATIREE